MSRPTSLWEIADRVKAEAPAGTHPHDLAMEAIDEAFAAGLITEDEIDLAAGQLVTYLADSSRR